MRNGLIRAGLLAGTVLVPPVLALPTLAEDVRLDTSVSLLDRSADQATYEISVRPDRGTARTVHLDVAADAPASWQSYDGGCRPSPRGGIRLACALGDLTGPAAVRVTLSIPTVAGGVGLLAIAAADNAAGQESVVAIPPVPSPSPVARSSKDAPEVRRPPVPTRPHQDGQSAPRPRVPYVPQTPLGGPRYSQPGAVPSSGGSGAGTSSDGWGMGGSGLGGSGAGSVETGSAGSGLRPGLSGVAGSPAMPGAQLPNLSTTGPLVAAPAPSASPGQAAASAPDTSQLSLVTATNVPGGHTAWVRVLGIVVAAEAAVLWLATTLGLWRRRMAGAAAAAPGPVRRAAGRIAASLRRLPFRR